MKKTICKRENLCTGCTACASICPKKCISMVENEEGFYYPVIDETMCVDCHLCENTCPVNAPIAVEDVKQGYVVRNKDPHIVADSTSGGSFTAFAEYTFDRNGLLFGVGFDQDMKVQHFAVDATEKERVAEMRGSKYVQSDLGRCFEQIKLALDAGRFVCFCGTPCQVSGLKSFLQKKYNNLLTVDLVCHGVSSPLIFEKYVDYMQRKYRAKVCEIRFRNKTYGYHSGTMKVCFENRKEYYGSGRIDYMLKAYFKGACSRYSCYQCPFKGMKRASDFTIFDSWHIEQLLNAPNDDDKGYTNLYVHTSKGQEIIKYLDQELSFWPANVEQMKKLDGNQIDDCPAMHSGRTQILKLLRTDTFENVMKVYLPVSKKDYVLEYAKSALYKCGILKYIIAIKHL